MKHRIISTLSIISLVLVFAVVSGCSSSQKDPADFISDNSEVRIYQVYGMDCPGWHGGLENLINKVPGVQGSTANWQKQQLRVVLEPENEVDDHAIYESIKMGNFTAGKRLE